MSILSTVCKISSEATRVDFVIDNYYEISLKNVERDRRNPAAGLTVKMNSAAQKASSDWSNF